MPNRNPKQIRIDNRRDVLLLLLYSPGKTGEVNEPVTGRTRLVKMLFLFKEEALEHFRKGTQITTENFYEYFAWRYGPFSSQVYDDLTFFQLRGFIQSSYSDEETLSESVEEWVQWKDKTGLDEDSDLSDDYLDYKEESFSLTDKGEKWVEEKLFSLLGANQKRLLQEFKYRFNSMPLRAILRYVYTAYPKMTEQSVIRSHVLHV